MYGTVKNLEQSKTNTMSHLAEVKSKYQEVPGNEPFSMILLKWGRFLTSR